MTQFCDICGREIFCDDEFGRVDVDSLKIRCPRNIGNFIMKNKTVLCAECVEEERLEMEAWANSDEARVETEFDKWAKEQVE